MSDRFELLSDFTVRTSLVLTSSFVAGTVYHYQVSGLLVALQGIYTRGAAGGYCELQYEWSDDGSNWDFDTTLNTTITASDPYFSMAFGLNRFKGPLPADGTAIRFVGPTIVRPSGYDRLRISAREGSGLAAGVLALTLKPERELV